MIKMHIPGDKLFVNVSDSLLKSGWYGGQWVKYSAKREVVLANESTYAGFLLLGHKKKDFDGFPYKYNDLTSGYDTVPFKYENKAINAYGQALMIAGGGDYDVNKNAYDFTQTYLYNQKLFINNASVLTNIDSGNPSVGIVSVIPEDNNGWLGFTLKY